MILPAIRPVNETDSDVLYGLMTRHATTLGLSDKARPLDVLKYYTEHGLWVAEHDKYKLYFAVTPKPKGVDGSKSAYYYDLHIIGGVKTAHYGLLLGALLAMMGVVFSEKGAHALGIQTIMPSHERFMHRVTNFINNDTPNILLPTEFVYVDGDDNLRVGREWTIDQDAYATMVGKFVNGVTEDSIDAGRRLQNTSDSYGQRLHRLWASAAAWWRKLEYTITNGRSGSAR